MPRRTTRTLIAAATAAMLTLAGCSGSDDGASSDATTTTTASTTSSVPTGGEIELRPYELLALTRPDGSKDVPLADPTVIEVDGTWYLYGTSSNVGFEMWSSTDLHEWEYGGVVWEPTEGAWNDNGDGGGYWAPDLHVDDDGIWMYYTAGVRIGVARADRPEGPFVDQLDHPLIGNGYGGIGDGVLSDDEDTIVGNFDDRAWDAWLHEAEDGSLYLYFSALNPFSDLRVVPMVDQVTPADVEPTVVISSDGHLNSWEGWVREGPAVVEHDGVLHLMYSGNAWSNVCYSVGVVTGTDPLGPFERREDNPILASNLDTGFYAPGHNSVIEGPNGELLAFFHVKLEEEFFGDRRPMYAELTFTDDGDLTFVDPPSTTPPNTKLCLEPTL